MENKGKFYSVSLASTALVLFLILILSTTALAATEQSASSLVPYAYITNYDSNTVSIIDTASNTVTATVSVGSKPLGVAVNPDGTKVYVANYASDNVSVIDTATNNVTSLRTNHPLVIAANPVRTKVYVATYDGTVYVIDTITNTVTATIGTGEQPYGITVSPDGAKAYVSSNYRHTVFVFDTTSNTVTATIKMEDPYGVAITPDGKKVYVANYGSNNVSVIDTATNNVATTIKVGTYPRGVAVSPDGKKVYVANAGNSAVYVIDTETDTVTATVDVGSSPYGVSVTPDGTKAYVANYGSNSVSVIDTATNEVIDTVIVGNHPTALGQFIGTPPTSQPVTDNYLVQVEGSSDVYLIKDGTKHLFTSPEALLWNGYSFDDVKTVTSETLQSYPDGEDISISQAIIDKYHELGGEPIFGASLGEGEKIGDQDSAGTYCSYVNFEKGSIECFAKGPNVGKAYAIFDPLRSKWASMGYAKSVLGYPIDNISNEETSKFGTPFRYQNFANGTEKGALEYNITSGNVYEIHGAIFAKWGAIGYANSELGLVTSDERDAVPSFKGTTGRVNDFENGHLHWHGSGDHYMNTYMTYGDLDKFYINMRGTASDLGFPIKDQETTADGHGYCEFEGGNISWDASANAYKAYYPVVEDLILVS